MKTRLETLEGIYNQMIDQVVRLQVDARFFKEALEKGNLSKSDELAITDNLKNTEHSLPFKEEILRTVNKMILEERENKSTGS